ncbi:DUF2938 domain-containing protein [Novosphingobium terrae]|uniref:DUF2938 domain-containing protein n=1 Tax=Novosphingobium terrae TaxID=2726189 RepID=UPI001F136442|nr:DUF2938 domain-containing protein [Novosphingobium terrae]
MLAVLTGLGGTAVLDLWALALKRLLGVPGVNWALVGRWIATMRQGRFAHISVAALPPAAGEGAIGWIAHYAIGGAYGLPLLGIWGKGWFRHPTVIPPLIVSWVLLVAPYFIMMPGMGWGLAGAKTPRPNVTRLKSVIGHSVFGLGMFATGLMLARI